MAASPRKSIDTVFQRVGVYGFGGSSKKKRLKYDIQEEEEDGTMEMEQIGAERSKNVLILMSDTGGGHRASAEAIRDAFKLEFGDEYRVTQTNLEFIYLFILFPLFFGLKFSEFFLVLCI